MPRLPQFAAALVLGSIAVACDLRAQGPAPTAIASPAASPAASAKTVEAPAKAHSLTAADLEAFLDALISSQIANRDIAGAVAVAVKDGQIIVSKGYGYADLKAKKPVLASETLFRPGSISKLFTAIAVVQLVEQGKLDLDRDVAEYLDFQIPATYPVPITLRHILTHTAGFEESLKNCFLPASQPISPLRDYLIASMPARIFPPGKVPAYSNWALTLAGYIVERASGEPFDSYIAAHILNPLKMEHSTFRQPLPDTISHLMSNGYVFGQGQALPFENVQAAPAGALSATGDDMGRFMLAVLNKGSLDGATILHPETLQQMQSRQFETHPSLNGIGLVFMQYDTNGYKAWGHGGDTLFFHSDLWLVPEANFGFFISYNSAAPRPGGGRGEVQRALFDRYFPAAVAQLRSVDPAVAKRDARAVAGSYEVTRRSETTLLKLLALLGSPVVRANGDGTISVDSAKNFRGEVKRWQETEPLVYREVGGSDKLAFRANAAGDVTELLPQPCIFEAQRSPWYDNKSLLTLTLGPAVGLIVVTALLWPVAAIVRRRYQASVLAGRNDRRLFVITRVACLVCFTWVVVLMSAASRTSSDVAMLGEGMNAWLHVIHLLGWLFTIMTLAVVLFAGRVWRLPEARLWLRAHSTFLGIASVMLVIFAWHVHLLDPSLRF